MPAAASVKLGVDTLSRKGRVFLWVPMLRTSEIEQLLNQH